MTIPWALGSLIHLTFSGAWDLLDSFTCMQSFFLSFACDHQVVPGSVAASSGLHAGDILVKLGGCTAEGMTHKDAQQAILSSGNSLEIIVER